MTLIFDILNYEELKQTTNPRTHKERDIRGKQVQFEVLNRHKTSVFEIKLFRFNGIIVKLIGITPQQHLRLNSFFFFEQPSKVEFNATNE